MLEQAEKKSLHLYRELGITYLRLGRATRARELFLQQREADPQDADNHNQLCGVFFKEGNVTEARQSCLTALSLDPFLDEAHMTLAQIAQQQEKSGKARVHIARAMDIQGRMDAALNQYQQAAPLFEDDEDRSEGIATKTRELEQLVSQWGQRSRR